MHRIPKFCFNDDHMRTMNKGLPIDFDQMEVLLFPLAIHSHRNLINPGLTHLTSPFYLIILNK